MAIVRVAPGTQARAEDVQQIIDWLQGSRRNTAPVSLTGYAGLSYALTVLNREDTNGLAFQVKNSDDNRQLFSVTHGGVEVLPLTPTGSFLRVRNHANNANIFEVTNTGVSLGGDAVATQTGAQTLTNKTLVQPILQGARVSDFMDVFQQGSAPAQPVDGRLRIFGLIADELLRYSTESDAERVLVNTDDAQTLVNKTLTAPVMTSPRVETFTSFLLQSGDPASPSAGRLRLFARELTGTARFFGQDGSGVVREFIDAVTAQTLSSKTLTTPTLDAPYVSNNLVLNTNQGAPAAPGANKAGVYGRTGSNLLHYKLGADNTERTLVDVDSPQNLTNKTISVTSLNSVTNQSQFINNFADWAIVNNPGAPAANRARMFMNVDNNVYYILPDGTSRRLATVEPITTQESFARSLMFMGA